MRAIASQLPVPASAALSQPIADHGDDAGGGSLDHAPDSLIVADATTYRIGNVQLIARRRIEAAQQAQLRSRVRRMLPTPAEV